MSGVVSFREYIAARLGTDKWCIAVRLTPALERKGYRQTLTHGAYVAIENDFVDQHPDYVELDAGLPSTVPFRNWILGRAREDLKSYGRLR